LFRKLSNIRAAPGFHDQVFEMLQAKKLQNTEHYSLCSIMLDGVSIRQQIVYDPKTKRNVGFVDMGNGADSASGVKAKEAIVIMAVGLTGHWKVPLGYFLTAGISAATQAQLIKQAISKLHDCGLRCISLVMDGHPVNQSMLNVLGGSLNPLNLLSSFPHPCLPDDQIYVFFDACHLIKLVRTALHDLNEITINQHGKARWFHISELHQLQEKEGLHAANKLSKRHIFFSQQKMKVKLATQTLSLSVAKAIAFLRLLDLDQFSDSEPTEFFITLFNNLFDIFNSKSAFSKDYKSPINSQNLHEKIRYLLVVKGHIMSMVTATGQNIYLCRKSFAFVGFVFNIHSIINMSLELLGPGHNETPVKYILTYKLSQDHLELFFSSLRSAMRQNNNPNALHLQYIWRGLLSKAGLKPSFAANCIMQDETELLCPSNTLFLNSQHQSTLSAVSDQSVLMLEESAFDSRNFLDLSNLSLYVLDILTYISGWVARKLIGRLTCTHCKNALITNIQTENCVLLNLKNNGGLYFPSQDLVSVVRCIEKAIRFRIPQLTASSSNSHASLIEITVMQEVPRNLFCEFQNHFSSTYHDGNSHYTSLIRAICRTFLTLRLHHIAKTTNATDMLPIRQKLTKTILFMNQ
jgi:hypothetical protein